MDGVTKKIKHILVASDFSKNADFALSRAIKLAEKFNARITVLHVLEKEMIDSFLDNTLKKILPKEFSITTEEYKEILLQEQIQKFSRSKLNINYSLITKGKPAFKILQYIKKNKIDLLVMGAHGEYSIRDTFLGTTAEYVAKKIKCPVLIVKNQPLNNYEKILIPTDFSAVSKKALNYAVQLFPRSNIHLLHVSDDEYKDLLNQKDVSRNKIVKIQQAISFYLNNQMKKMVKGYSKKLKQYFYNIAYGYPGPTIIKEAAKLKSQLIVMGTQGHGRLHYLFIGSVANSVITNCSQDILLVPPKK